MGMIPHGGVPEAHGAHGVPSASGPEVHPHGGSSRPGSSRPIGLGPSAMAHRPWPIGPGPWSPWGPIWACIFGFCIFGAKSTLLGVQTEPLFNKDCLQSFPGPLGPPSTRLYQFTDSKIFKFFQCFFFVFFLTWDPSWTLPMYVFH